jgi:hypothetical protein
MRGGEHRHPVFLFPVFLLQFFLLKSEGFSEGRTWDFQHAPQI